ncbi:MAG: hypothetical protein JXR64_09395 [Spirochaetales bacterium]|nr:hypothetical protein [Spirochaetales bacterium]
MSLLKTNNFQEAYNVSYENLISDEFKPILAESLILLENKKSGGTSILSYIENRKDPAFFEYISNLLNSDLLKINAALLWAKNGDMEKSYSLLKSLNLHDRSELLALFAYDTGRSSEALVHLLELPQSDSIKYENVLLIADLFYLKENWPRSKFYYEKALEINKFKSAPYLNISAIYQKNQNYKQALNILESGITEFKNNIINLSNNLNELYKKQEEANSTEDKNITTKLITKLQINLDGLERDYKEIVLLAHHLYNKMGLTNSSSEVILDYINLYPEDVQVELIRLREESKHTPPDIYISKLWKLLNKDKNYKDVSEFFIWYLLGTENYKDINLIIERNENRHPEDEWIKYYKGIMLTLNSNYAKGLEIFSSYKNPSWDILYNMGIINLSMQNFPEALGLFNKSIISLNQNDFVENKNKYLSKIKTKQAEVLISLNDTEEAIRVLNSAFELDPDNYTSDLLKSIYLNLKDNK